VLTKDEVDGALDVTVAVELVASFGEEGVLVAIKDSLIIRAIPEEGGGE
jgi:hypothetical protein